MHAVPRKPAAACGSSCILRWDFRQRSCELTIKCSNVGPGSHDLPPTWKPPCDPSARAALLGCEDSKVAYNEHKRAAAFTLSRGK
jgi:hypothetical protein